MLKGRDEERVSVSREGIARLKSAAINFAREEAGRIALSVIDDLRSQPPSGIFDEVSARHMWDEYCWEFQEGPFDVDMGTEDFRLGTISDAWDDTVRAFIVSALESLPKYSQVFLSALAFEDSDDDEDETLGVISMDDMTRVILNLVNERASGRSLDLIGPHRADAIGYHIEGAGLVWSVLSERNEAMDLISGRADEMIDPGADLSALATEMTDRFIAALSEVAEAAEDEALTEFLDRFGGAVRALVHERDVLPSLSDMQAKLLEQLDGC